MLKSFFLFIFFFSSVLAAKTDLAGCTLTVVPLLTEITTATGVDGVVTSIGNYAYTTFLWDGTEQCQQIDCGGGRAPPKTNVPGCPLYTGTDTVPSLPFPTASLTLIQAGVTSSFQAGSSQTSFFQASSAAIPTDAFVTATGTPTPAPTTLNSVSATAVPPITSTPIISPITSAPTTTPSANVSAPSAIQASNLNPTVTASPNGALGGGARWNMAFLGLAVVAMAAPHL